MRVQTIQSLRKRPRVRMIRRKIIWMIRAGVWNRKNRRKEIGAIRRMNQTSDCLFFFLFFFFLFFSSEDDQKIETAGP